MATLNWVGKQAVINHDKEVPFKLLKKVKSASIGTSQNLIVHGDNLEALKALMPHYQGRVKCIYIDPPYNTGNEGWVYNDKVNSPKIRQWLGKVVGRESEDLNRHDKWLCMMYPRLKLLRDLLTEDGVIFVSIDDHEHTHLQLLMNEIFGEQNFITNLIWKSRQIVDSRNQSKVSIDHEYIVVYGKTKDVQFRGKISDKSKYSNPDNDERGPWMSNSILGLANATQRPNLHYSIVDPATGIEYNCPPDTGWRYSRETMAQKISEGRIVFPKKKDGRPREKKFLAELSSEYTGFSSILDEVVGFTLNGTRDLRSLVDTEDFQFPKPYTLIKTLIQQSTSSSDIVLDSFAGSGTTGHAILDLNMEEDSSRKFILVELEDKVAREITVKRIKQAIKKNGYNDGFEYCELDKPLFNEHGQIEETCDFDQFASYVYFTETQTNIDPAKVKGNYIGENGSTEYYLIYKEPHKNDLDKSFLKKLEKTDTKKVVYADRCTLDEADLAEYNLVFKQIPYEVKVF